MIPYKCAPLIVGNNEYVLDRARVCTRAHHCNGRFAADFRLHLLHSSHQQIRREHSSKTGGDHLISHLRLSGAFQIGQHAQAVTGIIGAAIDNAIFPRAGYHARSAEAGVVITLQLVVSASTTMPIR